MTREELLAELRSLAEHGSDPEVDHSAADMALLTFIGDPEVFGAYEAITRWYA
jgi:hypothetical protein